MIINESNIDKKLDSGGSFRMQDALEADANATEALPRSASTGENIREIPIQEDDASAILRKRWIACYMLYDWNLHHADMAYLNNTCMWVDRVYKHLEGTSIDTESIKNVMTDTFNRILLEEVEDFIQTHMRVWKCDRLTVEMQVIKVEAELFPLRAYESDIAPVSEGDAQNEEGSI